MANEVAVIENEGSREVAKPVDPMVFFNAMDEEVQRLAKDSATKLHNRAKYDILIVYDLGCALAALRALKHLGDSAKEQQQHLILQYWGALGYKCNSNDVYVLCTVVGAFSKNYISSQIDEPLANGTRLTWKHFYELAKIDEDLRGPWLKRIREQSITSNQFAQEMRARGLVQTERHGGRNPTVPVSAPAIVGKTCSLLVQTRRFIEAAQDNLSETCVDYAPDEIDERYVNMTARAVTEIVELQRQLTIAHDVLTRAHERAAQIFLQRETGEDRPQLEEKKPKAKAKAKKSGARTPKVSVSKSTSPP